MHRCRCLVLLFTAWVAAAEPQESPTWRHFREQVAANQPTDLADYSFAGYARGEREPVTRGRRFDVTDFGAKPDDLFDDRIGITAAIAAAAQAGGGVVWLPRGRYLVNSTMALRGVIPLMASNIVVAGAGCGADGTIIDCVTPFDRGDDPLDLDRLHLGDTVFSAAAPTTTLSIDKAEQLARVIGDAPRGGRELMVDDASRIAVGDWVLLWVRNQTLVRSLIAPFAVEPEWTGITADKGRLAELHQVAAVHGTTVVFAEPSRYPLTGHDGWVLRRQQPIRDIGFEDLCFLGNAHQRYAHHRSDLDDSGWSFIKFNGVVDGWVRRCSFVDSSQAISVNLSAFVSLLNVLIDGNQGHHGLRSTWFNYGVLGGLATDRAGNTHGPSINMGAVGTVYWRCDLAAGQPLDCHSGKPFCSLFDACTGGVLYGSGGGLRDFPQHLRELMIWNLEHRSAHPDDPAQHYDFWRAGESDRFVMPSIVGLHGSPATFNAEHLALLESLGSAVAPASLYEAQLRMRLGAEPAWIAKARTEHEQLLATVVPKHFSLATPDQGALLPETFAVADLLRFITHRSLEVEHSRSFTWTADPALTMHADQNMVRDGLYALMCALYHRTREGNSLAAAASTHGVAFTLRSGPVAEGRPLADEIGVADARIFAAAIGGSIAVRRDGDAWVAQLTVP